MGIVSVARLVLDSEGEGLSLGETITFWLNVIKDGRAGEVGDAVGIDASNWRDWMPGNRNLISGKIEYQEPDFEQLFNDQTEREEARRARGG